MDHETYDISRVFLDRCRSEIGSIHSCRDDGRYLERGEPHIQIVWYHMLSSTGAPGRRGVSRLVLMR